MRANILNNPAHRSIDYADWLHKAVLVIGGSWLLWVSAKIQIPFYPVPMSAQTLVVLFLGCSLGWRLGALTVTLYLLQGAFGLPVFANTPERGIGIAYMLGPTGGYLVGFVLASALVGLLTQRNWWGRSLLGYASAFALGVLCIFLCGALWLGQFVGYDRVYAIGVAPFLYGEAFKVAALAISMKLLGGR